MADEQEHEREWIQGWLVRPKGSTDRGIVRREPGPPPEPPSDSILLPMKFVAEGSRYGYSPECFEVVWDGIYYRFREPQNLAVKYLMQALEEGVWCVEQQIVIREIKKRYRDLAALFRGHACWGVMILPVFGRQGFFRLAEMVRGAKLLEDPVRPIVWKQIDPTVTPPGTQFDQEGNPVESFTPDGDEI